MNRSRFVLWFICSELSSGNDTNAGPAPKTFGGASDSADAFPTSNFDMTPKPIPPAAMVAATDAGRKRRIAAVDAIVAR